tara:strand:+ start:711 stop:1271 length:561 start_codon:yes stop_codon:yes gene_type:complete
MVPDFIGVYDNVLSGEDCQEIIERMHDMSEKGYGETRPEPAFEMADESFRNEQSAFLSGEQSQNVFKALWNHGYDSYAKEFDILKRFAKHEVWQIKGQITKPGQGYHAWHCEAMDMQSSVRLLSYILYLNDIEEGGETEFLYYKKRIKPKAGTLLVFPAYFTHTHRGNTNLSNKNKVVLTGWYTFC